MNKILPDRRIPALDGYRGISILFVVVGHLVNYRYGSNPHVDSRNTASVLADWGVALFFVISGFIITRLVLSEYHTTGKFSIRAFYIRRAFRIIPPFYFYLIFIAVVSAWGIIQQRQTDIVAAAAFTCNFPYPQWCDWFPGHSWTLAYEQQFYLILPLLFLISGSRFGIVVTVLFIALTAFPFLRPLLHVGGDLQ
jgi:peptidoglycan/LPS O-acetylase OafA/YrhL